MAPGKGWGVPFGAWLTWRGHLLLGSAAVTASVYAATGSPGYAWISALLAALPLASALALRAAVPRALPGPVPVVRGVEGEEAWVAVPAPVAGLRARVIDPGGCVKALAGGGGVRCAVRLRIGRRRVGLPRVAVYDPFGFSYAVLDLGYAEAMGAPRPYPVGPLVERLAARLGWELGSRPSRRGDEFLYTRESESQEPPSLIDWKAFARLGRRVSKVMGGGAQPRLTLAVTVSRSLLGGSPSPFERAARLLLGLLDALCRLGVRGVVALAYGDGVAAAPDCSPEGAASLFASYPWGSTASPRAVRALLEETEPPRLVVAGFDAPVEPAPGTLYVGLGVEPPRGGVGPLDEERVAELAAELVGGGGVA